MSTLSATPSRLTTSEPPPGATSTAPAVIASPASASRTCHGVVRSSRSANALVNFCGMCCVITMPTGSVGSRLTRMRLIAGGPPVEAPMATSRGGARPSLRDGGGTTGAGGGANVPDIVPVERVRAARSARFTMRSCVTSRTFAEQLLLDVAQLGRDGARRLGHEVERAELERLEHVLARARSPR